MPLKLDRIKCLTVPRSQAREISGTPAMTTTKSYDGLNQLTSISSAPTIGSAVSCAYQYNSAGQREQVPLANTDTWEYGYNPRGEVTSGSKKQAGSTNLNGYQFGYSFDNIGNRTGTTREGRTASYTTNNLNQYTNRTVPVASTSSAAPTPLPPLPFRT